MSSIPDQRNTGHRARKRFGQNFLVSEYVIDQIIRVISSKPAEHIVEIGPGLGVLTERLLETGAQITAIELDRNLVDHLNQKFSSRKNFKLINADALTMNFAELSEQKIRVVGNLPYNISTPIMFRLLESADSIQDMHFMLQKEVVKRLASVPGTSAWGRLGIMVQHACDVEELLEVPPDSFDPQPKVDSAVVRLSPHHHQSGADKDILEKVVRIAFNKRRKTLRNALSELIGEDQIVALGIDPGLRPENLAIDDFIAIANKLDRQTD